jgi:lipoprotein NlpI
LRPAYFNRGALRIASGDPDGAVADFDAAIRLNPNDAMTFSNRAYAYQVMGEYGRAIPDLDRAIRLEPFNSATYLNRGVARLYLGRANAAIEDFATAVQLRPSDAHGVLWLHLARARAGQDDRGELAKNAIGINRALWPGPVVDLYLGTASPEAISSAFLSNGKMKAQRKRTCEIEFYLATFHIEKGLQEQARQHLRAAADICAVGGIEFIAVRAVAAEINLNR